jgi:predicted nucleotidyltransferase
MQPELTVPSSHQPVLPKDQLAAFCRRHGIVRLALFGSALTDSFSDESDLDFLAEWAPDAFLSLYDLVRAEAELAQMLGRRVDLVDRLAIEQSPNWLLRRAILDEALTIYEAA